MGASFGRLAIGTVLGGTSVTASEKAIAAECVDAVCDGGSGDPAWQLITCNKERNECLCLAMEVVPCTTTTTSFDLMDMARDMDL